MPGHVLREVKSREQEVWEAKLPTCNPQLSPWVLKCRKFEREGEGEVLDCRDEARSGRLRPVT